MRGQPVKPHTSAQCAPRRGANGCADICFVVQPSIFRLQAALGAGVLPASCVLVPKRDACAFLAQQEKPEVLPVAGIMQKEISIFSFIPDLKFCLSAVGFCSRYISRYVNLKLGFLPFVVASIVAMVFFFAVFAARAPAMGNSADRAWPLSQLVEGVLTACNPSHGSLSCVQAGHCVSKQIGRHDVACQGCPRCVFSRSPVLGTPQSRTALWGEEKQRSD